MDETSGAGDPTQGPGWLDDPFHRSGQRWWDGQQWTARARSSAGESPARNHPAAGRGRRTTRGSSPAGATSGSTMPSPGARPSLRPYALVVAGVLLAFTIVGLVAPSAEDSAATSDGYPRAAYWSCADLLTQRLGPSTDLEFPGDSTATITNEGPTWNVRGRVEIVSDQQADVRAWDCTVTHEDGVWRGSAALE